MVRAVVLLGIGVSWGSLGHTAPGATHAFETKGRAGALDVAARLAAAFGTITSIQRSPAHNFAVGGVPNSYHLSGRAIDIVRRPGVSHSEIAAVLRAAGYSLIESLDEGDHSHFAFGSPAESLRSLGLKGTVTATKSEPTIVQAEETPAPPVRRVAADYHGTLLVDLPAGAPDEVVPKTTARVERRR